MLLFLAAAARAPCPQQKAQIVYVIVNLAKNNFSVLPFVNIFFGLLFEDNFIFFLRLDLVPYLLR